MCRIKNQFKCLMLFVMLFICNTVFAQIDREALVTRHTVIVKKIDSLSSLSVGNGRFAFTVDATGLQSFPDRYAKGVPLGAQSQWGWGSYKNEGKFNITEAYKYYDQYGRKVPYTVQLNTPLRAKEATNYFRQNVHRLQLGNIGFDLIKKNGQLAKANDIKNINQNLNPWTGEIKSSFTLEGIPVEVTTVGHQDLDLISASVSSPLIAAGRLKIRVRYPVATGEWADVGNNWSNSSKHHSQLVAQSADGGVIKRQIDSAVYYTSFSWKGKAQLTEKQAHYFTITPNKFSQQFSFSCLFSQQRSTQAVPSFALSLENSQEQWKAFWMSGAAVDFSGSTDKRAFELERRIILSEYLTKIQCSGDFPPQETGLTYNSWFGKPHLEMHWWHGVHFALWGRPELLNRSTDWYFTVANKAKKIAQIQGFDGLRWQKMTDNKGNESPSSIGAMLIWQQPHFITFAELEYRAQTDEKVLQKYKDLVFKTADFMASFAHFDAAKGCYVLGPGLIPAQERFKAETTFNPTYELAYWEWGLKTAQEWRLRLGLPRNPKWDDVMAKLSPLPIQNGVYLAAESAPDSYTNPEYKTDHPSVLGAFGMLPETKLLDKATMRKTFDLVWKDWSWNDTWGWDFPMTAMTATRLGMPDKAIDALLMPVQTNTYLINGHNYQDDRLRIYLPGNGGLLTAVALMCAGWDGNNTTNPGFPKDGTWKVQWEGFKKMM
ncbi:hypothetical protein SRABI27_00517 [Pedobacter sp. Bi27]|uniref:hypothetical protein n=1 Tax=unclassified Pedobacter TaxID=2628915 RepID=UPI001DCD03F1|nr:MULTISPECIES: hypothetical protein [unclassified Pedobacter]CAH0150270.1 hypothetical protein SRABI126_00520 [Pedobacter sp. Bi126]CAH0150778.1 hypothetical protein SRABI27_00517 [Pedobacter sp. Bi27]CAH0208000.1 hypothetical protein SRABI36_02160 [Pedobacter sp. Bi36]